MILEIIGLSVVFETNCGDRVAVRDASLAIAPGERLALMGESGCGKTVLAMAVLGLLPQNVRVTGSIRFEGCEILNSREVPKLRGRRLAVCWSNAERFFDPVMTVGVQIAEAYRVHHPGDRSQAKEITLALLKRLGFKDPDDAYRRYPFQLSGGMNQRAMIAMSLINNPHLLIVDEPTRGLDDRNRYLVIEALLDIGEASLFVITHDLELVSKIAGRFLVMKRGEIIDRGTCSDQRIRSDHPYTRRLVDCSFSSWEEKGVGCLSQTDREFK